MSPKLEMQNSYHIRQICTCFLYWMAFLLSSSSENFPKHIYLARPFHHPDGAVSAALRPRSNSFSYTAIATDLSVAWCGPQCSGYSTSCSQCLQKHQQGRFIPSCLWLHRVSGLGANNFALSSFTVSPHIISLSNYFSSACQAVFIRRVFLSARLAFGLLIFEV